MMVRVNTAESNNRPRCLKIMMVQKSCDGIHRIGWMECI
jgi:hypothetical protein